MDSIAKSVRTVDMSYKATPPKLKGYKPLYKGRRYWIFQNDPLNAYESWTFDYSILVYHRHYDSIVACGIWKDGVIKAEICWGQGLSFEVENYSDMASQVRWLEKEYC